MASSMSEASLNPLDKCIQLTTQFSRSPSIPLAILEGSSPITLIRPTSVISKTNVFVPPHSSQSGLFTPDGTAVEDFNFLNSPSLEWLLAQAQMGELPACWEMPVYERSIPGKSSDLLSELAFASPQLNLLPPPSNLPAAFSAILTPSVADTWPSDDWSTLLPNCDSLSEIFPVETEGLEYNAVPVAHLRGSFTQGIDSAALKRKPLDGGVRCSEVPSIPASWRNEYSPVSPHSHTARNSLSAHPDRTVPFHGLPRCPPPGPPGMRGLEGYWKQDFRRQMAEQSSCVTQAMTEFQEISTNPVTDATSATTGDSDFEALRRLFAKPEASPSPRMNVRTETLEQTWQQGLMAIQQVLRQPVSLEVLVSGPSPFFDIYIQVILFLLSPPSS